MPIPPEWLQQVCCPSISTKLLQLEGTSAYPATHRLLSGHPWSRVCPRSAAMSDLNLVGGLSGNPHSNYKTLTIT